MLSPSALGGAKALPGAGDETEIARARGTAIHRLLEHLPALPQTAWDSAAPGIAQAPPGLDIGALLDEARRVLTAPPLQPLFAPETLAEVAVTGDIAGRTTLGVIDRLIVAPDHVLAVDFKTNATVPDRPEAVPEGILRQMGAYAALLQPLYPDRPVRTAILWSRTAQVMALPHDLVSAALARATGA